MGRCGDPASDQALQRDPQRRITPQPFFAGLIHRFDGSTASDPALQRDPQRRITL